MTPVANDLCVFAVKRGIIEGRIDPHFYLPEFQTIIENIKKTNYVRLGDIAYFSKDTTNYSEFASGEFKYLEISGVSLGQNKYKTTTTEVSKAPSRAKMKTKMGDIVIALTRPHRGAITTIKESGIIASTGFSVIRDVDSKVDKEWLMYVLLSNISLQQMLQRSSGGNYPAIIEEEVKRIYIPVVEYSKQLQMAASLNAKAYAADEKLRMANSLLINTPYILDRVGLSFDNKQTNLVFAALRSTIFDRIDADYYSPKFFAFRKQIEQSLYPAVSIGDISEKVVSGFAAGKLDQADDLPDDQRVPHLRPFSITPEGELSFETKKYVPKSRLRSEDYCKKNEVIFNNTNSPDLVGKTTVFDSDVLCAASNHMTRITVKEGVNPYYVAAFFNVLLSIGYWKLLCTNFNNQAGVNTETLKKVRIPLPPKDVQDQIAAELMQRRSQANTLRKQAIKEWAEAKAQFEKELLGDRICLRYNK